METKRLTGESMEWFEDSLENLTKNTRRQYLRKFEEFLEWSDMTTETLLKNHETNLQSDDKRKKKLVPKKVYEFQKYRVQEKGDRVGSTKLIVKAVNKFFRANKTPFGMNSYKLVVEEGKEETQELKSIPIISKAQLRQMLEFCGSIRMRAIIHVAKDTGLRISDVCLITLEHLQPILDDPKLEVHTFEITPKKNRRNSKPLKANPVMGPESCKAIRNWIRYREDLGIESDYVFTSVKNVQAHTNILGQNHKQTMKGDPLTPSNAGVIFRRLRDKAGLRDTGISIHSLRKYHKTNLEYLQCPTSWINKMQGRRGEGTGGTYTKPSPEQLIEIYSKAYHGLSLSEQPDTYNRLAELEKEVKAQKQEIDGILNMVFLQKDIIAEEKGFTTTEEMNEFLRKRMRNSPNP